MSSLLQKSLSSNGISSSPNPNPHQRQFRQLNHPVNGNNHVANHSPHRLTTLNEEHLGCIDQHQRAAAAQHAVKLHQQHQQVQQAAATVLQNMAAATSVYGPGFDQLVAAAALMNGNPNGNPNAPPPNSFRRGGNGNHAGNTPAVEGEIEKAAKSYRKGTTLYDATCTWSGQLPARNMHDAVLSCKVFLGGVPWDITEQGLVQAFAEFGNVRVEWPGKENHTAGGHNTNVVPKGYLYVIFEDDAQVERLLNSCEQDMITSAVSSPTSAMTSHGSWYFKISSRRMRNKEVQVIPWVVADSNYVNVQTRVLDSQKTVFVGALHGMLTAEGLCKIFNDLFGGVVYAGIDTDKYKYPIGSGRVTFDNPRSYMKAVSAAFIEIKTPKFTKKVQVDPYLEDALCSSCGLRQGPYFCREVVCFKYFCRGCWEVNHTSSNNDLFRHHKPLMRNSKNSGNGLNTTNGNNSGLVNNTFQYRQPQEC